MQRDGEHDPFADGVRCKPVVPGGAGGAMAPPDFGRSVNPISTKGVRLCPPNNTGTPGFSDLLTALMCKGNPPTRESRLMLEYTH